MLGTEEVRGLYRLAADQGNAWGQNNLGRFYEQGHGGLSRDVDAAIRWYQAAARGGETLAQQALTRLGETW